MRPHNSTAPTPFWAQVRHATGDVGAAIAHQAARLRDGARNLMVQTQIARMQSILHGMSDAQLDQIGITRGGIRKYAVHLVTAEYDGI